MDNNWHTRYAAMKSGLGLENKDIAGLLEKTERSVVVQVAPSYNRDFPTWAKAMILAYELMIQKQNK